MTIPNEEDFLKSINEYERQEKRDAMYKVATFLVSYFWGRPSEMADGLGVLLLTWNQAFYRYGVFDFDRLERWIQENMQQLEAFRSREISSLSSADDPVIRQLFEMLLDALAIDSGKSNGSRSPVAAAKALHLLAPGFFPLWDTSIARAYNCYYTYRPSEKYVSFCHVIKGLADVVRNYAYRSDRTVLKLIDEYNYARYTKGWVE